MKRILFLLSLVLFLSVELFAVSSKEMGIIINLAGKQRMLTQKMSKEALLIRNNIEKQKNKELLKSDIALFDKTLNGLIGGDQDLKLVKVDDEKVQTQLKKVKKLWEPMKSHLIKVANLTASRTDYRYISNNNITLLKNMHQAVLDFVDVSKKVSKIKSTLAEDINIAGRQRMLTQKMAKDMLQITSNIDVSNSKKDLIKTKKLFDSSLNGLLNTCKIYTIKRQLDIVKKLWDKTKKYVNPKYAINKKSVRIISSALDKVKVEMNKAVTLYQNSAKRQILKKSLANIVNQLMIQKNLKGVVLNLSGRQRMLTQRIAKNALLIAAGIDKEFAKKDLLFSINLYNKTLNGFINGDPSQRLVATKDFKIRKFLENVKANWEPFYENAIKFLKTKDRKALKYIIVNNENMLKLSHHLVQMYKHSTTSSNISKEMAEKVDLSGRQRMLSQKMLKEKIMILYNLNKGENEQKLKKDMDDFATVLHDLMKGSKERGWSPEPISYILAQLKIVDGIWKKFQPILLSSELSKSDMAQVNKLDMKLLFEMNKAVKMYEEASDIYDKKFGKKRTDKNLG
jgi:hypothetical protein